MPVPRGRQVGSIGFADSSHPPMQVTEEDGGKLNAFAKEPRMVIVEEGEEPPRSTRWLLIGGMVLVAVMVAVAAGIS